MRAIVICSALLLTAATAGAVEAPAPATPEAPAATTAALGSANNPVRCHMPAGERAYLNRLRGPDGKPPTYRRAGSVGKGADGHVLDRYEVMLGKREVSVYFDMYHEDVLETAAVPGFTIVPP